MELRKDITEIIEEFAKSTQYFTNCSYTELLTKKIKTNNLDYIELLSRAYCIDLERRKFYPYSLIFIINEKIIYKRLDILERDTNKYKNSKDYLLEMKQILIVDH